MNGQDTFEARVADMVDLHLIDNPHEDSGAPLLSLLGCSSIQKPGDKWIVHHPEQPALEHDELVRNTLLSATRWFVRIPYPNELDAFSIFDGLAKNQNWRHCLTSADSAYDLVALSIQIPLALEVLRENGASDEQIKAASAPIDTVLREWMPAAAMSSTNFTFSILTRTLFGDAWSDLVLSDTDLFDREIAYLVRTKRPAFLPGTLTCEVPMESGITRPEGLAVA